MIVSGMEKTHVLTEEIWKSYVGSGKNKFAPGPGFRGQTKLS